MASEITGPMRNPDCLLPGFPIHEIEGHVHGRNHASAQVLTGVAALKSRGLIGEYSRAGHGGAVYQDGTGVSLNTRGRRFRCIPFPCIPKIDGRNLRDIAQVGGPLLAEWLKVPLDATELLPSIVHHADKLFEANGACEAVVSSIQRILDVQEAGKPVDVQLVRDVLVEHLLPGYRRAYEKALTQAQQKPNSYVPTFNLFDPRAVEKLNRDSISTPYVENLPKQNVQGVADVLALQLKVAKVNGPAGQLSSAIAAYVAQLSGL